MVLDNELKNRIYGCLFGGAAGDALGYTVEFMSAEDIFSTYGNWGITGFKLYQGKGLISDDTQLALFTAVGLLTAYTKSVSEGSEPDYVGCVYEAYKDWLKTQFDHFDTLDKTGRSWLLDVSELYSCRAPGNTCISALESNVCGSVEEPVNHSQGCGGIMRIAPVGVLLARLGALDEEIIKLGAAVAAITHGHPLGYIPSATMVLITAKLIKGADDLVTVIKDSVDKVCDYFSEEKDTEDFKLIMHDAVSLALGNTDDAEAIRVLGEGFVAHETLAIAAYCSIRYRDDFDRGICVSVNHDGDSDSTGELTGNILGAWLGFDKMHERFSNNIENKEVLTQIADDMISLIPDDEKALKDWNERYLR